MSRIRADQLVNRAGSGGPKFPNGVADGFSVSGVVTATSYRGDGSQLTGIDASSLKDGSNVKVQAVSGGANVTGDVTATGNVTAVNGTFSGNATVQGNLTVNGTTTTIDTAVTAVDSLAVEGNVGIGITNPTNKIEAEGSASVARFVGNRTDALGPRLSLAKSRGSTSGSATIVQDGDEIGQIMFKGADGTDADSTGAAIIGLVDGTPGVNDMPGALTFLTTNDGTNSPTERLRIDSSGNVNLVSGSSTLTNLNFTENQLNTYARIEGGKSGSGIGDLRFHTYSGGLAERLRITSDGHIFPGADNTQDLGSSSKRFANIYTGDLNLSNEGSTNDVDGTWGQYTIQEGENDLFLINRRTGKKYKFNLTEVD